MKAFDKFLIEAQGAVKHIEHLEDMIFIEGVNGTRNTINMLIKLRNAMYGKSNKALDVKTKWDGSPAVIFGFHPVTNKFFVGTKGVFAKDPKINYTPEDVDANHDSKDLQNKLKLALKYLKDITPNGIFQGDFLYSNNDIKITTIKDVVYVSFQPNTLVYAIEGDSPLAKTILRSSMGLVVHTRYKGNDLQNLSATFDVSAKEFRASKQVWLQDAEYTNQSGKVSLTKDENDFVTKELSNIGKLFNKIKKPTFDYFITNEDIRIKYQTFVNSLIRQQQFLSTPDSALKGFIDFYTAKLTKDMDAYKTQKSKEKVAIELQRNLDFLVANQSQLLSLIEIYIAVSKLKVFFVGKLNSIQTLSTFIKSAHGYEASTPEGFVATDLSGKIIKLVDRLNFSYQNFTAVKNWVK